MNEEYDAMDYIASQIYKGLREALGESRPPWEQLHEHTKNVHRSAAKFLIMSETVDFGPATLEWMRDNNKQ